MAKKGSQKWKERIGQKVTKMSDEVIGKLEYAFSIDCTIAEACFYADINPDTYYTWVKKFPKLSERFEELRNQPVLTARTTLINNLGRPGIALEYLKKKRREEFGDVSKLELEGKIQTEDITISEAQKKAIEAYKAERHKQLVHDIMITKEQNKK